MDRLIKLIDNSYNLGMSVQDNQPNRILAEEVASECGEFLAMWADYQFADDPELEDPELRYVVNKVKML